MYDVKQICERYNSGEPMTFLFFWGHTTKPGQITKSCLSQWYPCSFAEDEIQYHTMEQYMMAHKALLFGDQETYQKIMASVNPSDCKKLGRKVGNFNSDIWDVHKSQIVVSGNRVKFSQNPDLKEFLLNTGESILVEASPSDSIWGVRMQMDNPDIQNPNCWKGENLLGFALMETRDSLRDDRG